MLAHRASVKCCPRQRYGSALSSRAYTCFGIEPSPKIDRASGVRASRQKIPTAFCRRRCLPVRSSFDVGILRADESRPRSSILYGLSPGQDEVSAQKIRSKPLFLDRLRGHNPLSAQNSADLRRRRLREGRERTYRYVTDPETFCAAQRCAVMCAQEKEREVQDIFV